MKINKVTFEEIIKRKPKPRIYLTRHAMQRLQETPYKLKDIFFYIYNSTKDELRKEDRNHKRSKYGEEDSNDVLYRQYGTVRFICKIDVDKFDKKTDIILVITLTDVRAVAPSLS